MKQNSNTQYVTVWTRTFEIVWTGYVWIAVVYKVVPKVILDLAPY